MTERQLNYIVKKVLKEKTDIKPINIRVNYFDTLVNDFVPKEEYNKKLSVNQFNSYINKLRKDKSIGDVIFDWEDGFVEIELNENKSKGDTKKYQAIHKGMHGILTNIDLVKKTAMFSKFGKQTPYLVSLNDIQWNTVKKSKK